MESLIFKDLLSERSSIGWILYFDILQLYCFNRIVAFCIRDIFKTSKKLFERLERICKESNKLLLYFKLYQLRNWFKVKNQGKEFVNLE